VLDFSYRAGRLPVMPSIRMARTAILIDISICWAYLDLRLITKIRNDQGEIFKLYYYRVFSERGGSGGPASLKI